MIFNWWGLVIFVILMAVVSAIAIRGGARRPARSGVPIARITRVVAVIYVATSVVGTLIVVLQTLINSRVRVWMPVREFWPNLPSTVQLHGVSGQVVGGGFSNADVEVTGLDSAARIWLASGALVQGLTAVMVGLVVAKLCTSVIRQNPFRAMLSRGINLAAFGILIGGILWQICLVVGNGMASTQVLGVNGWDLDEDNVHWDDVHSVIGIPEAAQGWNIDFWPLGIGLSLLAVSAVFRYGQQLQKETDGLI